jgi:hypothetical protein
MGTFQFVSELIMTLLFLAAAIWGAVISFGKRSALFLQIVACGLGCMALGNVFSFVLQLTAPEEILRELTEGFHIGLLGIFGMFAFLFSASFGQIDGLGDDKSEALQEYRLIALAAPAGVIVILILMLISGIGWQMQVMYGVLFLPAMLASYYNLKHLIIPDVEDGILAAIRKYNIATILLTVLVMITFVVKMYGQPLVYGIVSILCGVCALFVLWFAKEGTERWLR